MTRIILDYYGLCRITSDYTDYPGLPVRITKWSIALPELFPPWDYRGLLRSTPYYSNLLGLLRITHITLIYLVYCGLLSLLGLHRITLNYSDYPGL